MGYQPGGVLATIAWAVMILTTPQAALGQVGNHVYPSRGAAEAAKGARGTVVESLGKIWLFTIAEGGWRPSTGERVAEIGPLPLKPEAKYTAQYMEAIL